MTHRCRGMCGGENWVMRAGGGPGTKTYDRGMKRCGRCVGFIMIDGHSCPCCGTRLRLTPRGSKRHRMNFFKRNNRVPKRI